jgi:hypothetical protein
MLSLAILISNYFTIANYFWEIIFVVLNVTKIANLLFSHFEKVNEALRLEETTDLFSQDITGCYSILMKFIF